MAKEKSSSFFKLPFKLPIFRNRDEALLSSKNPLPHLKMIVFIAAWEKSELISKVFDEEQVRFHFICPGRGTASSDVLDLLGLGSGEKAVITCVEQEILVPVLLKEVRKKLGFYSPGAGIAFTIPLSGINTPLLRIFKESIAKNEKIIINKQEKKALNGKGETMAEVKKNPDFTPITNDLIIALINHGYSEDLMTVAREAGASGGTVIHARGLAHEGPVKFFGVSVQEEKELVLILTSREKKLPIMEAVSRSCGITSQAGGFIFSLPVDNVLGLNLE